MLEKGMFQNVRLQQIIRNHMEIVLFQKETLGNQQICMSLQY